MQQKRQQLSRNHFAEVILKAKTEVPYSWSNEQYSCLALQRLAGFTPVYNGKRAANAKLQQAAGTAMIGANYADSCLISQFHTQNKF